MKQFAAILLSIASFATVCAQSADSDKIEWAPTGRLLIDAGMFVTPNHELSDGVTISDARLGFKASYKQFDGRVEIGYSNEKVSLKDAFIRATFTPGFSVRVGNFYAPFGQLLVDSSNKINMMRPRPCAAFCPGRAVGIMADYSGDRFLAEVSFQAEPKATILSANAMHHQSWSAYFRTVYRPVHLPGKIFHVGVSAGYVGAEYNSDPELSHSSFTYSVYFPSRVSRVVAAEAVVTDARSAFRLTPELIAAHGRFALQSQYFFNHTFRKNGLDGTTSYGAYAIFSGLIKGDDYCYGAADGRIAVPKPGSLELTLAYSYTALTPGAEILQASGGRVSDYELGCNWYINKYIIWRAAASYTSAFNLPGESRHTNATTLQTRLQLLF